VRKFVCSICGYVYDESAGIPEKGIAPGTAWEDVPTTFVCPVCTAPKAAFQQQKEAALSPAPGPGTDGMGVERIESATELSAGEISAICSSLAKGCEKQRLLDEMEAFTKIADYFKAKTSAESGKTLSDALGMLSEDMAQGFAAANAAAKSDADRGALRSLVWSEKVSVMAKSLLERFLNEGEAMLAGTQIYVCDICGFLYLGDAPPEICPVCKVPSFKILPIEMK